MANHFRARKSAAPLKPLESAAPLKLNVFVTKLQEIEQAIEGLSRKEFLELIRHLRVRHADAWDRQIEEDAKNGRLDRLWQGAVKEIEQGGLRPLDEILDDPGLSQAPGCPDAGSEAPRPEELPTLAAQSTPSLPPLQTRRPA